MAVNLNSVPNSVKMAASALIIIGFVDLFIKIYFRIGGLVDASNFTAYLLSLALSAGEILSGYLIFYRFKIGYLAGWVYAMLELFVGVTSLMNYFNVEGVTMDPMYLGNLFVGMLVVFALSHKVVFRYCFRLDEDKQREPVFRRQIRTAATIVYEYGNFHDVK